MDANRRVGNLPTSFERVTAVLPEYQAYIVKKWAEDAQKMNQGKAVRMKAPVCYPGQSVKVLTYQDTSAELAIII